jgi:hypothetical protein
MIAEIEFHDHMPAKIGIPRSHQTEKILYFQLDKLKNSFVKAHSPHLNANFPLHQGNEL